MILSSSSDAVRVASNSSATISVYTSFVDRSSRASDSPGRHGVLISSATTVTITPALNNLFTREIESICIANTHASLSSTITVTIATGIGTFTVYKVNLGPGETATYQGGGWSATDSFGRPRSAQSLGSVPANINEWNVIALGTDVTNNNAVANTLQDVTGLAFPVTAGQVYAFEALILYTAAATTTGSRWTLNGPSANAVFVSEYSLAATTTTRNANNIGWQQPAAANASSGALTSNLAQIKGIVSANANGNVQVQFASEVAASAIVAKAGSILQWMRTF